MPRKRTSNKRAAREGTAAKAVAARVARAKAEAATPPVGRSGRASAVVDTRVVYCGDCLDQLRKLPDGCVR